MSRCLVSSSVGERRVTTAESCSLEFRCLGQHMQAPSCVRCVVAAATRSPPERRWLILANGIHKQQGCSSGSTVKVESILSTVKAGDRSGIIVKRALCRLCSRQAERPARSFFNNTCRDRAVQAVHRQLWGRIWPTRRDFAGS